LVRWELCSGSGLPQREDFPQTDFNNFNLRPSTKPANEILIRTLDPAAPNSRKMSEKKGEPVRDSPQTALDDDEPDEW
jgi:hypothetical protein